MRRVSDWRSDRTASEFLSHDRADLAQEFLCRNSAYEREYYEAERRTESASSEHMESLEALAHRWGLSIPCSPNLSPLSHPAHWGSDFAPTVVILGVASFHKGSVIDAIAHRAKSIIADVMTSDGRHLVIVDGKRRHRLRLVHIADIEVAAYATTVQDTDRVRLGSDVGVQPLAARRGTATAKTAAVTNHVSAATSGQIASHFRRSSRRRIFARSCLCHCLPSSLAHCRSRLARVL